MACFLYVLLHFTKLKHEIGRVVLCIVPKMQKN